MKYFILVKNNNLAEKIKLMRETGLHRNIREFVPFRKRTVYSKDFEKEYLKYKLNKKEKYNLESKKTYNDCA